MRRLVLFALVGIALLSTPAPAQAQAATVAFDYAVGSSTAAQVQGWVAKLYVNSTAFTLNDSCAVTGVSPNQVITCTATLPNITSALTASGAQTFTITLTDTILEGAPSAPLSLTRPGVVTAPRIQ